MIRLKNESHINRANTFFKDIPFNVFKATVLPAVAYLGLNVLGIKITLDQISADLNQVKEAAFRGIPFVAGFATGLVQNAVLIKSTLHNLEGGTEPGNYEPIRQEKDGTYVFQLACVDKRRKDKSGVAVAGSYGLMGAEATGILGALFSQQIVSNTPQGDFVSGYLIGSNVLSTGYSHMYLFSEILRITNDSRYKGHRIKIEMMDHFNGCGAEAFTNPISYLLKFKAHQLTLADIVALPNEIAGYVYVNGILGPAVGIASLGRVSLCAIEKHSEMNKTSHH
ncbi:MAG: hypothetical protein Q7R95_09530 [bacterium]|nr:hypothetical protein [bacterium]